ncbi:MAG: PilZ domain-containing protein [Myxococcota bacterium]
MYAIASDPVTLLAHDGELEDVSALLSALEAPFIERLGPPASEDTETPWALIVASARRMLELDPRGSERPPVRIAILESEVRSVRTMLRRAGVNFIVRRPVHPAALRLLLLHALYRQPERRRSPRVIVGAPVRFRTGLRRRKALLEEVSLRGCRLLTSHRPQPGSILTVYLPCGSDGRPTMGISGKVLRVQPPENGAKASWEVAVGFQRLSESAAETLARALAAYEHGPSALPRSVAARPRPTRPAENDPAGRERRVTERHSLVRHIIARSDSAIRVLLARDLSFGGLRVDPHPSLIVGDRLQIALHVSSDSDPLVVWARVSRDDGERGLVLRFHELGEADARRLEAMRRNLPTLEAAGEDEQGAALVVSEVLDHQPA